MQNYKERKKRAKKDLFSALIFYGSWSFEHGMDQGMEISDPKRRNPARMKRYEKGERIIENYIYKKWINK